MWITRLFCVDNVDNPRKRGVLDVDKSVDNVDIGKNADMDKPSAFRPKYMILHPANSGGGTVMVSSAASDTKY